MSRVHLCSECVAAGVAPDDGFGATDMLVACAGCGAIDELATYARNAVDVHERFGTLMGENNVQFHDYEERKHEEFVDCLLDAYLADPSSRVIDRPGDHFKAGAKTWYNRYRQHEQVQGRFKRASTNSAASKVKYLVAVAVHVTIMESNVAVVNNRLAHVKPFVGHHIPTARGDGTIMAPSLRRIFARAHALGPSHVGYLETLPGLSSAYARFKEVRGSGPSAMDITLAHVYVISQHIQLLARLPHALRIKQMGCNDLKPAAVRKRKTVQTADPDDFILGSDEWEYISKIDWSATLEMAYHLYCAQEVVALWGNRCSADIGLALLQWAIMATVGTPIPGLTALTKEMLVRYGGNEGIVSRRREEIKDMVIGWSTSFPDAGIPVPILPAPRKGTIGNGLSGYGSDKRRPIPETTMAIAAAPVVAAHWRLIMDTRLRTRTRALPLDTEFTMAARMFAAAYTNNIAAKRQQVEAVKQKKEADRQAAIRDVRLQNLAAKRASSVPSKHHGRKDGFRAGSRFSRSPSVFAHTPNRAVSQPPQAVPPSPSLEALLATREDSSDDDGGRDSDGDDDATVGSSKKGILGELGLAGVPSVPFGFSIGPNGFSVATNDSAARSTVPVGLRPLRHEPPKRSAPGSVSSDDRSVKRRMARRPSAPMSPPPTSPSMTMSPYTSRKPSLSPAPSEATVVFRPSSPTPSLRSITMSPSLTAVSGDGPSHVGCLVRERPQYAYFSLYNEQRSGTAVSPEVERAMNAWVADAKAKGIFPAKITSAYLAQLGFHGDPRLEDLGPFIRANPQWSPTESLLRLGIRPFEFPVHLVVHSLLDLEQQLGHFRWDQRLHPGDARLTQGQLDAELDLLFANGSEKWRDLIASPAEAARKEKMYLKAGVWGFPRNVPEGTTGRIDEHGHGVDTQPRHRRKRRKRGLLLQPEETRAKRIDMDVLDKLVGDYDEVDEEGLLGDVVGDSLWSALGRDAENEDEDDEDEDDDNE